MNGHFVFVVTVATSAAMLVCGATPDRPLPPDHVQQRDIAHVRTVADGAAPDLPSSGLSAPSLVDGNTSIVESARDLVYRLERERVTLRKRMLVVVISCAGASAAQFVVAHFDWRSLPWRTLAFGHVTGLLGDIVYGKPPVMTAALMVATLGTSRKASHHWRHTWSKVLRQLDADERNSTGMPLEEDRRSQARLQKLTLTVNADFASRFGYSLDDVFASGTRLRWLTQAIKCGFVHHPTIENHLIGNVLHLLLQCTFTEKLHGSQRMLLMHISSILGGAFAHVLVAQRTGNSSREMRRFGFGASGASYGHAGAFVAAAAAGTLSSSVSYLSICMLLLTAQMLPGMVVGAVKTMTAGASSTPTSHAGHVGGFVTGVLVQRLFDGAQFSGLSLLTFFFVLLGAIATGPRG